MRAGETTKRPTLSVPEAGAEYFGVAERTAYRLAAEGLIPTLRIGRRLFVKRAELERQLGMRASDPEPAT